MNIIEWFKSFWNEFSGQWNKNDSELQFKKPETRRDIKTTDEVLEDEVKQKPRKRTAAKKSVAKKTTKKSRTPKKGKK